MSLISARTELDVVPAAGRSLADTVRQEWVDRLVDLRVLATHGDVVAALDAAHLVAHDAEARAIWDTLSGVGECLVGRPGA